MAQPCKCIALWSYIPTVRKEESFKILINPQVEV